MSGTQDEAAPDARVKPNPISLAEMARRQSLRMSSRLETLSALDRVRVQGAAIGDVTPEQAMEFAAGRDRDARFARMVAAGVPAGKLIRHYVRPAEADSM